MSSDIRYELRFSLHRQLRSRLHQPLPFLDVFAHEGFVGGRRGYDAAGVRLHAARNAEPAMHVDPLVFETSKPALNLLEIREVVDLPKIRELLLSAHA